MARRRRGCRRGAAPPRCRRRRSTMRFATTGSPPCGEADRERKSRPACIGPRLSGEARHRTGDELRDRSLPDSRRIGHRQEADDAGQPVCDAQVVGLVRGDRDISRGAVPRDPVWHGDRELAQAVDHRTDTAIRQSGWAAIERVDTEPGEAAHEVERMVLGGPFDECHQAAVECEEGVAVRRSQGRPREQLDRPHDPGRPLEQPMTQAGQPGLRAARPISVAACSCPRRCASSAGR